VISNSRAVSETAYSILFAKVSPLDKTKFAFCKEKRTNSRSANLNNAFDTDFVPTDLANRSIITASSYLRVTESEKVSSGTEIAGRLVNAAS
jgi:hypothetical protein